MPLGNVQKYCNWAKCTISLLMSTTNNPESCWHCMLMQDGHFKLICQGVFVLFFFWQSRPGTSSQHPRSDMFFYQLVGKVNLQRWEPLSQLKLGATFGCGMSWQVVTWLSRFINPTTTTNNTITTNSTSITHNHTHHNHCQARTDMCKTAEYT